MKFLTRELPLAAAFLALAVSPSLAGVKPPPTCQSLYQRCVAHVTKANAKFTGENASGKNHMTAAECSESEQQAEQTGVWPAHLPHNFAMACTK